MTEWTLTYGGWLVWDGQYPDIALDVAFRAAIEFWPVGELAPSSSHSLDVRALGHARYQVVAKVVEVGTFVVLDLGPLTVSCMARPWSASARLAVGDQVEGQIGLGLDPSAYFGASADRTRVWTPTKIRCTRFTEYPTLARSVGDEDEEIASISTDTVDSLDSCTIQCVMSER